MWIWLSFWIILKTFCIRFRRTTGTLSYRGATSQNAATSFGFSGTATGNNCWVFERCQNVATVVAWAQLGKLYWYSLSTDVVVVLCEEGEAPLAQLVSVVDLTGLQDPGQEFTKN